MRWMIVAVLMFSLFLLSCDSDGKSNDSGLHSYQCLETYSAENGYGFDNRWREGSNQDESGSNSVDSAQSECESEGGGGCAASGFITTDAAICLAQVYGMDEGIGGYQAHLVYNYNYKAVIWAVDSLFYSEGACSQGGENMYIHATTGELLGAGYWDQTC